MSYDDCTNPTKPCRIHDQPEDWHIVIFNRPVHAAWLVVVLVLVIAVSTLPGLN